MINYVAGIYNTFSILFTLRIGMTGVRWIVKGLGAGFHQPVDGIHCLTVVSQQPIILHSHTTYFILV